MFDFEPSSRGLVWGGGGLSEEEEEWGGGAVRILSRHSLQHYSVAPSSPFRLPVCGLLGSQVKFGASRGFWRR